MISHESSFLNRVYQKKFDLQERAYKTSLLFNRTKSMKRERPKKLPPNFNKFLYQYFDYYYYLNIPQNQQIHQTFNITFIISGLVLDSPYTSLDDLLTDNIKRFIPWIPSILTKPVNMYYKSFLLDRVGEDLNKNQNIDIIKIININTLMIMSKLDQMVPLERF